MPEFKFTLSITGPDGFSLEFPLPVGLTRLGRQPGNSIVLPHTQVSRGHAQIETTADSCQLTDLGSSNGTSLNGEKINAQTPMALKDGDRVKIGPFEIDVHRAAVKDSDTREMKPPQIDPSVVSSVEPAPEETSAGAAKPEKEPDKQAAESPRQTKSAEKRAEKKPPAPETEEPKPHSPSGTIVEAPPPAPPPPAAPAALENGFYKPIPGLSRTSTRLLEFLPGIFHTDFMARFLAIFEATQVPIEWTIDNFDLFLDPLTAPEDFLPWLSSWYGITFDSTWTEEKRRSLLKEAPQIYARRGTRWALGRILAIYTGVEAQIDDTDKNLDPFTFTVTIPLRKRDLRTDLLEALIDAHKPAHTSYKLTFKA